MRVLEPPTAHEALPPFDVRRMCDADLDEVMKVERRAFKHPWSTELFQRELMHEWSTILVAVTRATGRVQRPDQGQPVLGFIIYWLVHDEVHVLNVATDPDWRRQGIGRRLLVAAVEQGRARGARLITLEVRRSNFSALSLYRDMGFRAVGIRPNYYVDEGEDAVVMNLEVD
jgi:ribosomal-protein-alanine N-acetyltransferase